MASLVSVATAVALAISINAPLGSVERASPSIGGMRFGQLRYQIRALNYGSGLGGGSSQCAARTEDLLMIVYTVNNDRAVGVSAQSVPRLTLISPEGNVLKPDAGYTQALANKVYPRLAFRQGRLESGRAVVLADVFVTPRRLSDDRTKPKSITEDGWRIKPNVPGTTPVPMVDPAPTDVTECPRFP